MFASIQCAGFVSCAPVDGSVTVTNGSLRGVRPWRKDPRDSFDAAAWKVTTHRATPWTTGHRERGYDKMPIKNANIIIELTDTTPS